MLLQQGMHPAATSGADQVMIEKIHEAGSCPVTRHAGLIKRRDDHIAINCEQDGFKVLGVYWLSQHAYIGAPVRYRLRDLVVHHLFDGQGSRRVFDEKARQRLCQVFVQRHSVAV